MKKLITMLLVLTMVFSLVACGQKAEETPQETTQTADTSVKSKERAIGILALLNMTEEEYLAKANGRIVAIKYLAEQGVYHSKKDLSAMTEPNKVIFYDTLDAMLMALEAGEIRAAGVPQCTADYLCAQNDKLTTRGTFDLEGADDFTKQVAYRLGVGFSFLTTEDKADLRDELDQTLTEMKSDGTLDALVKEYINDAENAEPQPVEFTKTDGETVKIAVTGALPPMDYVSADGTPAGFNTAILAELGRRLNKNFELVQVDSLGRAAALTSGKVDLVFWTNSSDGRDQGRDQTTEEIKESIRSLSEEQIELIKSINNGIDHDKTLNKDVPEGTITTQPYYSDMIIPVVLK